MTTHAVRRLPHGSTTPLAPSLADATRRLAKIDDRGRRALYALEVLDLIFADHAARRRVLSSVEYERALTLKRAAERLAPKGGPR